MGRKTTSKLWLRPINTEYFLSHSQLERSQFSKCKCLGLRKYQSPNCKFDSSAFDESLHTITMKKYCLVYQQLLGIYIALSVAKALHLKLG